MLAPGVQHIESVEAAQVSIELELYFTITQEVHDQSGIYDPGMDLGLAGSSSAAEDIACFEMPNDDYFNFMRSLIHEQIEFVYDAVHQIKI